MCLPVYINYICSVLSTTYDTTWTVCRSINDLFWKLLKSNQTKYKWKNCCSSKDIIYEYAPKSVCSVLSTAYDATWTERAWPDGQTACRSINDLFFCKLARGFFRFLFWWLLDLWELLLLRASYNLEAFLFTLLYT